MNFIYFPKPGRKYEMPELLKDEVLEVVRKFCPVYVTVVRNFVVFALVAS